MLAITTLRNELRAVPTPLSHCHRLAKLQGLQLQKSWSGSHLSGKNRPFLANIGEAASVPSHAANQSFFCTHGASLLALKGQALTDHDQSRKDACCDDYLPGSPTAYFE